MLTRRGTWLLCIRYNSLPLFPKDQTRKRILPGWRPLNSLCFDLFQLNWNRRRNLHSQHATAAVTSKRKSPDSDRFMKVAWLLAIWPEILHPSRPSRYLALQNPSIHRCEGDDFDGDDWSDVDQLIVIKRIWRFLIKTKSSA